MHSLYKVIGLIYLGFLTGCASVGLDPSVQLLAQIDDVATGPLATRPVVIELEGKLASLYANKANQLTFQYGSQRRAIDPSEGANFFQLRVQDQHLHALWWSHAGAKNLYITSSTNRGETFSPVSIINDSTGVLPPFSVTTGSAGQLGVTYHDERLAKFQAYFNRSTDYGRTWPKPDFRLDPPPPEQRSSDVHEPKSVESGPIWFSAWTDNVYVNGQQAYRIVSRLTEDAGLTWTEPKVLYSADHQISSLQVKSQGDNIVIAADDLNRGVFALSSTDQGRNWKSAGIVAGSDGVSNSGVALDVNAGRAHLVWMLDRKGEKTHVMRAGLDTAQATWFGPAERMDEKVWDNTRSLSPEILVTKLGVVMAAWVDYSDIRPNIYLSASGDQGATWSKPKPMLTQGEASAGWPNLIQWGDSAAVAYEIYPTDRIREGKFIVRELSYDHKAKNFTGLARPVELSDAARKSRLEQRVKNLWDARVAGDYETAYDMFDFAYKAAYPKRFYVSSVGVITYLNHKTEDLSIAGNEAHVKMKIKYEVTPTTLPTTGTKLTIPPVEIETPTMWVWVGNDWYMVFKPSYDPAMLEY
jgi:hypothetical protein